MSSSLLDLDEILRDNKERSRSKLKLFANILDQCFDQIKRYNKEHKVKECTFTVPAFKFGHPPYDLDVLVNYLSYNLRDNGLYCEYIVKTNQLYICWKEEYINFEKYKKRKMRLNPTSSHGEIISSSPKQTQRHRQIQAQQPSAPSYFGLMGGPVNAEKSRGARMKQRQKNRNIGRYIQNQRTQVPKVSFKDFMKTF